MYWGSFIAKEMHYLCRDFKKMKMMQKQGVKFYMISFFLLVFLLSNPANSQEASQPVAQDHAAAAHEGEKEFNAVEMIMHHISDANEWHLWTTTDENGEEHHVSIPLPIIILQDGQLHAFMSSQIAHGHEHDGFKMEHGRVTSVNPNIQRATVADLFTGLDNKFIDHSISKNVAGIMVSIAVILMIFIGTRKAYAKNNGVPKGIAGFTEPIILFIRDEVAIPNIGHAKAG